MSTVYYTTVENPVVDDEERCREILYYIGGMIPNTNITEWKRKQENTPCVFVPIFPDHEELEVGTLYVLKYFGDLN